jgi:pimeloyl-ACP methyl ester carboxylesterase
MGGHGSTAAGSVSSNVISFAKKHGVIIMRLATILFCVLISATVSFSQTSETPSQFSFVKSKDGTRIAVECTGKGPSLLIVHGGTGDRSRWQPLLPLFASHFRVCAMDRRGHGSSESGSNYSLSKEPEDVVAVVNSVNSGAGPVFVLGHSIGGVWALEAAFLTNKISKLVLYEPPLQDLDHTAIAGRMEKMIQAGDREQALVTFLREIVMISPDEIAAMKRQAAWPRRIAGIDIQIREIRAMSKYRFDGKRMKTLRVPTLLLAGSKTASPQLKQAINSLMETLPHRTLVVFEGQEHNAMDKIPQQFAETVTKFLGSEQ